MLHSPRPPSTAATPAGRPAPQAASPPSAVKRRGNPDLNLSPRCGARTRAGCPCRAPAIRGKLRCRMHGGRSTGPRTAEGRARIAAAHTRYSPEWRARCHFLRSLARRGRVFRAALDCRDRLPPELAARLWQRPPELRAPHYPAGGIAPAEDRAMRRAEAASLAPWEAAIALARQAGRPRRGVADGQRGVAPAEAQAPAAPPSDPAAAPRDPVAQRAVPADVAITAQAPECARDPGASAVTPSGVAPCGVAPCGVAPLCRRDDCRNAICRAVVCRAVVCRVVVCLIVIRRVITGAGKSPCTCMRRRWCRAPGRRTPRAGQPVGKSPCT